MEYLISEVELKALYSVGCYDGNIGEGNPIREIIKFLDGKQPVELLDSGIVQGDFGYDMGDRLVEYYGSKVKLYIEVPK